MDECKAFRLNVGQAIKVAREDAGLSQTRLARMAGTSQNAISCYESGKVCMTAWTLHKLCEVLKVSADELLGLGDECE